MAGDRRLCHPKSVRRHRAALDHAHRSAVSARHDEEHFPRQNVEKSTVFDLVYEYLGKCADKDRKWRQRNCACNNFNKRHARKRDIDGRDVATIRTNFGKGIFDDDDERPRSRANKNMLSNRASRSSSTECVTDYTKTVRDGRRHAKFYVREALLYGLQSGLLIPTDRRRNVLRVSRKLETFLSRNARDADEDSLSNATSDTEYSVRDQQI